MIHRGIYRLHTDMLKKVSIILIIEHPHCRNRCIAHSSHFHWHFLPPFKDAHGWTRTHSEVADIGSVVVSALPSSKSVSNV